MFGRYTKSVTAVVGAVLAFAGLVVFSKPDAITSAEWYSGAVGLATALGVYALPNQD